jgi:signal peptidase I
MYFDFAFYFTIVVIITGLISLFDQIFFRRKRMILQKKPAWIIEYSRSFFPVLFVVWAVRSFLVQPYRVPTGSLEPTILPGDFIAVNQFAYGLRFPIGNITLIPLGLPKRGDIALFRNPLKPSMIYVKRVIGLPGDHVEYINKVLYINGKRMQQNMLTTSYDIEEGQYQFPVIVKEENLDGIRHKIFVWPGEGDTNSYDFYVPAGMYFVMGDNRDNSDDSRDWGFVSEHYLIGKAFMIWLSWDSGNHTFRWYRVGRMLH